MKRYTLLVVLILLMTACKKETKEITAVAPPLTSVDVVNPCYGDNWTEDQDYKGMGLAPCLIYNNKAYFINRRVEPTTNIYQKTVTVYDGTSWQVKPSNVPGQITSDVYSFRFVIGNKGYVSSPNGVQMFAYDFVANTWQQKASFPGPERTYAAYFSIGNKGYIVGGRWSDTKHYNDTWEYNPANDSWTQKKSFPNFGKQKATGFTVGNKGYIVNGVITQQNITPAYNFYLNDLMEYDPSDDSWEVKAPFPGQPRSGSNVFVIASHAYVGGGYNGDELQDFYRYNPATNAWIEIAALPGPAQSRSGFAINSKGYVVMKNNSDPAVNMQKYTPKSCPVISPGVLPVNGN